MLARWIARRRSQPPAPATTPASDDEETTRRFDAVLERTHDETRALAREGAELESRIRRNARAGRNALQGK